ncbi:MAG: hypothetical protein WAM14_21130 [Candidatus Nitrosopolaris sp.]
MFSNRILANTANIYQEMAARLAVDLLIEALELPSEFKIEELDKYRELAEKEIRKRA